VPTLLQRGNAAPRIRGGSDNGALGNASGPIHHTPGGRTLSRRIISMTVAAIALLAAFGCGSGGSDTSVRSGTDGGARVNVAAGAVDAAGLRTVTYRGVEFQVPGDWPVYDLAADPTTCVRFDVHAVYLGQPSADMQCPAGLIGRADAVLVEPAGGSGTDSGAPAAVSTESVNGLDAQIVSGADVTYQLDATFATAGVSATITYQDSDATARQILSSFRGVAR
jgi:hypothetical protein